MINCQKVTYLHTFLWITLPWYLAEVSPILKCCRSIPCLIVLTIYSDFTTLMKYFLPRKCAIFFPIQSQCRTSPCQNTLPKATKTEKNTDSLLHLKPLSKHNPVFYIAKVTRILTQYRNITSLKTLLRKFQYSKTAEVDFTLIDCRLIPFFNTLQK